MEGLIGGFFEAREVRCTIGGDDEVTVLPLSPKELKSQLNCLKFKDIDG